MVKRVRSWLLVGRVACSSPQAAGELARQTILCLPRSPIWKNNVYFHLINKRSERIEGNRPSTSAFWQLIWRSKTSLENNRIHYPQYGWCLQGARNTRWEKPSSVVSEQNKIMLFFLPTFDLVTPWKLKACVFIRFCQMCEISWKLFQSPGHCNRWTSWISTDLCVFAWSQW